jgi:hypothetical protein
MSSMIRRTCASSSASFFPVRQSFRLRHDLSLDRLGLLGFRGVFFCLPHQCADLL